MGHSPLWTSATDGASSDQRHHRIELVPGLNDPDEVVADVLRGPLERLAASTLERV